MGAFDFLSGKKAGKVDKLIAQLNEKVKKPEASNNFGFAKDEKIIDEMEKLGDPAAIPALAAKARELEEFLATMELFSQAIRDMRLFQALTDLGKKTKRVIVALGGRELAFVLPCTDCGKRTRVAVTTMAYAGTILSGEGPILEFRCQFCHEIFRVSKEELKPYIARCI